jgi:hypothetical protein
MKISATGSGGFSGRSEHYEVDTGALDQGASIEARLRALDFFGATPPAAIGADLGRWDITVADGARRRTVTFAEDGSAGAAPWQALVAHLRTLA